MYFSLEIKKPAHFFMQAVELYAFFVSSVQHLLRIAMSFFFYIHSGRITNFHTKASAKPSILR